MKKLYITLMLLLPLMAQAQTVLTEEQQLEQAQKQLEAAQKALKIAKLKAEAARLKAQTDSINRAAEQTEAEAKAATQKVVEHTECAENTQSYEPVPALPKEPTTPQTGWMVPTAITSTAKSAESKKPAVTINGVAAKVDPKYLEGAVTLNKDGKVEFVTETDCGGKSAQQIYDIVYKYMSELTLGENNIASRIALVNQQEHVVANAMDEWLVFNASFISLDRTEFRYNLIASISDNHLKLTLGRIVYTYEEGRSTGFKEPAEQVITDKLALSKKKNDLAKLFGKFRRLTIDRKDQIFQELTALVKQ